MAKDKLELTLPDNLTGWKRGDKSKKINLNLPARPLMKEPQNHNNLLDSFAESTGLNKGIKGFGQKSLIQPLSAGIGHAADISSGIKDVAGVFYDGQDYNPNQPLPAKPVTAAKPAVATTTPQAKQAAVDEAINGHLPMKSLSGVYKGKSKAGNVSYADKSSLENPAFGKKGTLSTLPSMPSASPAPRMPNMQVYNGYLPESNTNGDQVQKAIKDQIGILNSDPRGVSDLLRMKYATKTLAQLQGNDVAEQEINQQQQAMGQQGVKENNTALLDRFKIQNDSQLDQQGMQLDQRRLELANRPKTALSEFGFMKGDDGSIYATNKQTGAVTAAELPSDTERQNLISVINGTIKTDGSGKPISPEFIEQLKAEGNKKYGANFWM